jgi:DMSO/TMAO reductase YedYZ heme-binding membrane subunit
MLKYWWHGVRLYIAIAIGLVTLETWWWASASYAGSSLFAIRLEEVFAWLALGLLVVTMLIGPVYKIWPKLPAKFLMRDARRLLGVGTAWFAALHVGIVYTSLFKWVNPLDLPPQYQHSFVLGVTGLLILLALAFTSFDRAFRGMGIWWFRLHRLVYTALVVSLWHAYLSGTHARRTLAVVIFGTSCLLLLGLHGYVRYLKRKQG